MVCVLLNILFNIIIAQSVDDSINYRSATLLRNTLPDWCQKVMTHVKFDSSASYCSGVSVEPLN